MSTHMKVRGIYSTALTKLLLDSGYTIVDPSPMIRERFKLDAPSGPWELLIQDRDDLQGIEVTGSAEHLCQFFTFLQEQLLDVVMLDFGPAEEDEGLVQASIEFPGASKARLDALRSEVVPTLLRHHRLRTFETKRLEQRELLLGRHPERKAQLEEDSFAQDILHPLEKTGAVRLEHMRPSGKPMRPREGVLVKADKESIVFKRHFGKGRYDGLDLPIQAGDYALTEVHEGAWYIRHRYFTHHGELIGEYYNINTPVELYPFGARYVDLEIDIIRRAGEPPFEIDQEKLAILAKHGCISPDLESKAIAVAEEIVRAVNSEQ